MKKKVFIGYIEISMSTFNATQKNTLPSSTEVGSGFGRPLGGGPPAETTASSNRGGRPPVPQPTQGELDMTPSRAKTNSGKPSHKAKALFEPNSRAAAQPPAAAPPPAVSAAPPPADSDGFTDVNHRRGRPAGTRAPPAAAAPQPPSSSASVDSRRPAAEHQAALATFNGGIHSRLEPLTKARKVPKGYTGPVVETRDNIENYLRSIINWEGALAASIDVTKDSVLVDGFTFSIEHSLLDPAFRAKVIARYQEIFGSCYVYMKLVTSKDGKKFFNVKVSPLRPRADDDTASVASAAPPPAASAAPPRAPKSAAAPPPAASAAPPRAPKSAAAPPAASAAPPPAARPPKPTRAAAPLPAAAPPPAAPPATASALALKRQELAALAEQEELARVTVEVENSKLRLAQHAAAQQALSQQQWLAAQMVQQFAQLAHPAQLAQLAQLAQPAHPAQLVQSAPPAVDKKTAVRTAELQFASAVLPRNESEWAYLQARLAKGWTAKADISEDTFVVSGHTFSKEQFAKNPHFRHSIIKACKPRLGKVYVSLKVEDGMLFVFFQEFRDQKASGDASTVTSVRNDDAPVTDLAAEVAPDFASEVAPDFASEVAPDAAADDDEAPAADAAEDEAPAADAEDEAPAADAEDEAPAADAAEDEAPVAKDEPPVAKDEPPAPAAKPLPASQRGYTGPAAAKPKSVWGSKRPF